MEVIHELLGVPKIQIVQDDELNTFSIDSNLIAYFATIKQGFKRILDLGTGNAPIPLYLTLRTNATIYGIEIQDCLYELAKKSVKINMKEDQIHLIKDDLANANNHFESHSFDLVISNPPFFKVNESSHTNPSMVKKICRHEVKTNLDMITHVASQMLKSGGYFAIVHRTSRLNDIIVTMKKYHIEPKRIRFVYPNESSESNQVLVEGILNAKPDGLKVLRPLYVHPKETCNQGEIIDIYNGVIKEWFLCS